MKSTLERELKVCEIVEREALATRLARGVQPAFVPVYFPAGGPTSVWAVGQRPSEGNAPRGVL